MSSNNDVRIKTEENDEVTVLPTKTAPPDPDELQPLTKKLASRQKYPPGCPVWYNIQTSAKSLNASHGIVKAVFMDIDTRDFIYRISGAEKDNHKHYFWENELVYAMNCPVRIHDKDGIIIFPKYKGGKPLSYTVQYHVDGGHTVMVESEVDPKQISFRQVEKKKEKGKIVNKQSVVMHSGKEDGGDKNQLDNKKDDMGELIPNKSTDKNHTINQQGTNNYLKEDHDIRQQNQNEASATHAGMEHNQNNTQVKVSISTLQQQPTNAIPESKEKHDINRQTFGQQTTTQQDIIKRSNSLPESKTSATNEQPHTIKRSNSAAIPAISSHTNSTKHQPNKPHSATAPAAISQMQGLLDKPLTAGRRWEPPTSVSEMNREPINGDVINANQNEAQPQGRWTLSNKGDGSCVLTVPLWVTETMKSLYLHIIGHSPERGHKTKEIERVAGCAVSISRLDQDNGVPMKITLKPMIQAYCVDMAKAKIMIENSVFDFLHSNGTRTRLINEWSISGERLPTSMRGKRKLDSAPATNPNDYGTSESPSKALKITQDNNNDPHTCVLTVPLWVTEKSSRDDELFLHLLGDRPRGHNTRYISSQSNNCNINLTRYNSKNQTPMTITIRSSNHTPTAFNDVRIAKRMITDSLIEFLCDPNSERRLIYDLATHGTGSLATYGRQFFRKTDGAVHQECQITNRMIWMKLLWLPMSDFHGKKLVPHGKFLLEKQWQETHIGNTNCDIEVYGFYDKVPILSDPYVFISCANNPHEANEIANRVENELIKHQQRCEHGCKFYYDKE